MQHDDLGPHTSRLPVALPKLVMTGPLRARLRADASGRTVVCIKLTLKLDPHDRAHPAPQQLSILDAPILDDRGRRLMPADDPEPDAGEELAIVGPIVQRAAVRAARVAGWRWPAADPATEPSPGPSLGDANVVLLEGGAWNGERAIVLPRMEPRAVLIEPEEPPRALALRCTRMWIDPQAGLAVVVLHGEPLDRTTDRQTLVVSCDARVDHHDRTAEMRPPGVEPLPFSGRATAPAPLGRHAVATDGDTRAPQPVLEQPALPFREAATRFEVETYGAVLAALDLDEGAPSRVLAEHDLSPAQWTAGALHLERAIARELESGPSQLLERCDRAYVERLERERGPLGAEDYAEIEGAAANVRPVLERLGIPLSALVRVRRVWMKRLFRHAELAAAFRAALRRRREARDDGTAALTPAGGARAS